MRGEVQGGGEGGEGLAALGEDEVEDQGVEDVEAEGDLAEVGEPAGDAVFGQAEEAEEEKGAAGKDKGPSGEGADGGGVEVPAFDAEGEEGYEPAGKGEGCGEGAGG